MGIFYHPPPHVQPGPVNSTPPIPHVAIQAQGDQPPRRQVASAMMMVAVLASWPTDLEPRLQSPNNSRVQSAQNIPAPPVTFVPYTRPRYDVYTLNQDAYTVELVQSYVVAQVDSDQPPRQFALSPPNVTITQRSWEPEPPLSARLPQTAAWNVPSSGKVPFVSLRPAILEAWADSYSRSTPPVRIAPLTLIYGDPPVPQPPLAVRVLLQVVSTWVQTWEAQSAPKNAGWNVPPTLISLPHVDLPKSIWTAWEPPWIQPPRPVSIAPLTLTYGDQPVPKSPLAQSTLLSVVALWQQSWTAQTASPQASWNVPPVLVVLPRVELPRAIWAAWEPPFVAPPRPVSIAPLTLSYGAQPTPQAPLSIPKIVQAVAAWTETWTSQSAAPQAGWNVPPLLVVLPRVELPRSIWTAWEPPWIQPPQPVSIAPLTYPSSIRPIPQPPISTGTLTRIVATWEKTWGAQSARVSAAWDIYIPPIPVIALVIERTGSYIPLIEKTGELDLMARIVNYGGDETLFIGEDKILDLEVLDRSNVPVNVAGMVFRFVVRLRDNSSDPTLLNEVATVVGVYNGVRSVNTQRLRVLLTAANMNTFEARAYRHSWKRMDSGSSTVAARGDFYPQRATANITP